MIRSPAMTLEFVFECKHSIHIILFGSILTLKLIHSRRGNKVSVYVASSKASGQRVTIKESHLQNYNEKYAVHETYVLADLAHESLPTLRAIFITDSSLFLVCHIFLKFHYLRQRI